jgi:chemotaxis signal transduction protein
VRASLDSLKARLLDLRESFDRPFREPLALEAEAPVELLAIRIGNEPFALRLADIAALEADRTITHVPSQHPELLGIAGVRGSVVAVFDLAALLDLPRPDAWRWLVLAKGAPLAFAFSAFEQQLAVRREALASTEKASAGMLREIVRVEGGPGEQTALPLIDLPALVFALERRPRSREEADVG